MVQTFFHLKVSKCVYKLRHAFAVFGIILYCFNAWAASQLEASNRMETVINENHPIEKAQIIA